jgi:hypothetical protein
MAALSRTLLKLEGALALAVSVANLPVIGHENFKITISKKLSFSNKRVSIPIPDAFQFLMLSKGLGFQFVKVFLGCRIARSVA